MITDIAELVQGIKNISSEVLGRDVTVISGFSERQVRMIAENTLTIQQGIANGDIDSDLQEYFLGKLKIMTQNYVDTLKGIMLVTLEKLWNAVMDFLYKVIGLAT